MTKVFFATNRNVDVQNGREVGFGRRLNDLGNYQIRYGDADLEQSPGGDPPYALKALHIAPEALPGIHLAPTEPSTFGSTSVFNGLRLQMLQSKADLILLLHGYACEFTRALSNAAELKENWGTEHYPLEAAVFSWPANGETIPWVSYASDRDDARASAKAVERALMKLLEGIRALSKEEWCGRNLHLVAHSMGNYVLRNALQAMISDLGGRPLPRIFKTIFLMAADEDNDAFEHDYKLARLPELAESVHVYFASNDRALTLSDVTKGNPDRLGTTGPRTLTSLPHKIALVDCSQVSNTDSVTDANHQYYRKRAEVLADIRQVLRGVPGENIEGRDWIASRSCFRIRPSS